MSSLPRIDVFDEVNRLLGAPGARASLGATNDAFGQIAIFLDLEVEHAQRHEISAVFERMRQAFARWDGTGGQYLERNPRLLQFGKELCLL